MRNGFWGKKFTSSIRKKLMKGIHDFKLYRRNRNENIPYKEVNVERVRDDWEIMLTEIFIKTQK